MNNPTLRDRRRTITRDELYRALERREKLLTDLVRNYNKIRTVRRRLAALEKGARLTRGHAGDIRVSVASGEILEPLVFKDTDVFDDMIPDLGGAS
jgi:hypothetical protein